MSLKHSTEELTTMTDLTTLASKLNGYETRTGATLSADVLDNTDVLKITSSADEDSIIFLSATDEQIMTVTPLFKLADVPADKHEKLFNELLTFTPFVPLTSMAIQSDGVILFGAMSVNTVFENIVEEIDVQTSNYSEVLVAFSDYFQ